MIDDLIYDDNDNYPTDADIENAEIDADIERQEEVARGER